ncbi:hypothetical protein ABID97_003560 [Variovorax sp. OAS795]|uniref:hypothetical protein n=1 Tax=Variovorax sp. OAS795 TaxID=3034231 RepID=UPI00339780D6
MRFLEGRGLAAAVVAASVLCTGSHAWAAAPVELPSEPLSSLATRADPNLMLDLALEFSNTGAAYRDSFDWKKVYRGHWDPMACYGYAAADGYFRRIAPAAKLAGGEIACTNQWSGNLLNWAATSTLDVLRLGLTGGDRVVDEADRTVLQRAVLQEDFYRSSHFPDKAVTGNLDRLTPLVADTPHRRSRLGHDPHQPLPGPHVRRAERQRQLREPGHRPAIRPGRGGRTLLRACRGLHHGGGRDARRSLPPIPQWPIQAGG